MSEEDKPCCFLGQEHVPHIQFHLHQLSPLLSLVVLILDLLTRLVSNSEIHQSRLSQCWNSCCVPSHKALNFSLVSFHYLET